MPILAVCPNCQQNYHVGEQFAGKTAKCQACGKPFKVPVPEVDPLGDAAALVGGLSPLAAPEYTAAAPLPPSNPLGAGGYAAHSPYASPEHRRGSGSALSLSAGEPIEWALRPGFTCSILGIGGFLLPLIGVQFKILAFLGAAAPVVGGLLAVAGAILLFLGLRDNVIKALGASAAVLVLAGGAFLLGATAAAIEDEQVQDLAQPLERPVLAPPANAAPMPVEAPLVAAVPSGVPAPGVVVENNSADPASALDPPRPQEPVVRAPLIPSQAEQDRDRAKAERLVNELKNKVGNLGGSEKPPEPAPELMPLELEPPSVALPLLAAAPAQQIGANGELRGRQAEFSDLAPEGGWLVGLRVIQSKNWGGAVLGVQPIYQVADKYVPGAALCGTSQPVSETILLAKPGFAVSGMRYHAGLAMNSLQLEFREVRGQKLVAKDAYVSEWIGCEGGSLKPPLHGQGEPIRGIDGTSEKDLTSLRLHHANAPTGRR